MLLFNSESNQTEEQHHGVTDSHVHDSSAQPLGPADSHIEIESSDSETSDRYNQFWL